MTRIETEGRHGEGPDKSRKNTRIRMRFPLTVSMPGGRGRVREVPARTVVVSHAGATLDVDEAVVVGLGVQLSPPFGGTLLAEVTGAWVDEQSGRHRASVRLIDPQSWTTPERFAEACQAGRRTPGTEIGARVRQMLADYSAYLGESGGEDSAAGRVAEQLLESVLLSDAGFQNWLAAKVECDLQAWVETCFGGAEAGPDRRSETIEAAGLILNNATEQVFGRHAF